MEAGIGLHRHLAPLSEPAWEVVDEEAREVLRLHLAARKVMEFEGPHGWGHSAVDLGDVMPIELSIRGALFRRRRVRPLVELRVPFELERAELERIDRGGRDPDLDALRDAARRFAAAEDIALFEGIEDADLPGLLSDADHAAGPLPEDGARIPDVVVEALGRLRRAASRAVCARARSRAVRRAREHRARRLSGAPPRPDADRRPGRLGAAALRRRRPLAPRRRLPPRGRTRRSIGYLSHDEDRVRLYLEESFSAELTGPEAVVPLARTRGA